MCYQYSSITVTVTNRCFLSMNSIYSSQNVQASRPSQNVRWCCETNFTVLQNKVYVLEDSTQVPGSDIPRGGQKSEVPSRHQTQPPPNPPVLRLNPDLRKRVDRFKSWGMPDQEVRIMYNV